MFQINAFIEMYREFCSEFKCVFMTTLLTYITYTHTHTHMAQCTQLQLFITYHLQIAK